MTFANHILVLNYEYPPVGGGAGQVTQDLCRFFSKKGIKQIIITGWIPGLKWFEVADNIKIIRVPMIKFRTDKTSILGMASYIFSSLIPMFLILLTKKIDIIHAHFAVPVGVLALLGKKMFKIPFLITLHGGDVPGMVPEQTDELFRYAKKAADAVVSNASYVVAVSHGLKELAEKSYSVPIVVISNGIDIHWIAKDSTINERNEDEISLVFAGRLIHQKNVLSLIRAMSLLPENKKWRLDILGNGPLMDSLKTEASGFANIYFHGWVSEKNIKEFLRRADIFLLPSFSEGLSISILQAMASGCALVASDIPMNKDIVDEGCNGYFCKHDPESIAIAVMKCLPRLKEMKKESLRKAKSFTWDIAGEQYLELFQKAIQ